MSQSSVITLDSFSSDSICNTNEITVLKSPHLQLMHVDSNLNLAGMVSAQSTITEPQPRELLLVKMSKNRAGGLILLLFFFSV